VSCNRFPECRDCAFDGVEPAICDECVDADQFQEADTDDDAVATAPLYYRPWKDAA